MVAPGGILKIGSWAIGSWAIGWEMWGKLGNRKFVAKRWNEGTLKRAAVKLGDKRAEVRWEEAVRNILTVWHPHDILNNFHFDTCSIVILPIVVSDSLFERQGHLAPIKSNVFWFPNWNVVWMWTIWTLLNCFLAFRHQNKHGIRPNSNWKYYQNNLVKYLKHKS